MGGFVKTFVKFGLGLTSATVLVLGLQAQAAAAETLKPGAFLLAQNVEPKKEKAPATTSPTTKPAPPAKPGQPQVAPEAKPPARRGRPYIQEAPGASGTKRIGGGTIRDKKGPEDE